MLEVIVPNREDPAVTRGRRTWDLGRTSHARELE